MKCNQYIQKYKKILGDYKLIDLSSHFFAPNITIANSLESQYKRAITSKKGGFQYQRKELEFWVRMCAYTGAGHHEETIFNWFAWHKGLGLKSADTIDGATQTIFDSVKLFDLVKDEDKDDGHLEMRPLLEK